jgi:hypothetical protein
VALNLDGKLKSSSSISGTKSVTDPFSFGFFTTKDVTSVTKLYFNAISKAFSLSDFSGIEFVLFVMFTSSEGFVIFSIFGASKSEMLLFFGVSSNKFWMVRKAQSLSMKFSASVLIIFGVFIGMHNECRLGTVLFIVRTPSLSMLKLFLISR